jgi:hypothetical protein
MSLTRSWHREVLQRRDLERTAGSTLSTCVTTAARNAVHRHRARAAHADAAREAVGEGRVERTLDVRDHIGTVWLE